MHSVLGLLVGLGLLVAGVSGSLLVFADEIDRLLGVKPPPLSAVSSGPRLPYDALFARVRAAHPQHEIRLWVTPQEAALPEEVELAPTVAGLAEVALLVDPRTGWMSDAAGARRSAFREWLLKLHITLLGGEWGRAAAGLCAALLCLLGLSGLWLHRYFWRNLFRLRWQMSARIFCSDLHKAVGISSVAFNLVLGFTGAWWNLSNLHLGHETTAPEAPLALPFYNRALSIDRLIDEARAAFPALDLSAPNLSLPPRAERMLVRGKLTGAASSFRDGASWVEFDPRTGALAGRYDLREAGWWEQTQDLFGPLHTGTFGGLPIKILWCALGLAPGALAVSGALLWKARHTRSRIRHELRSLALPSLPSRTP